jgi:hypothetical protein
MHNVTRTARRRTARVAVRIGRWHSTGRPRARTPDTTCVMAAGADHVPSRRPRPRGQARVEFARRGRRRGVTATDRDAPRRPRACFCTLARGAIGQQQGRAHPLRLRGCQLSRRSRGQHGTGRQGMGIRRRTGSQAATRHTGLGLGCMQGTHACTCRPASGHASPILVGFCPHPPVFLGDVIFHEFQI